MYNFYKFTGKTKKVMSNQKEYIVHQIQLTKDYKDVAKKGDIGGYINPLISLTNSWVCPNSVVCGKGDISDSTITQSKVVNSTIHGSTVHASFVTKTYCRDSVIAQSNLQHAKVENTETDNLFLSYSDIVNSNIKYATVSDSRATNCDISDSVISDNSQLVNSHVSQKSTLRNSSVINSNVTTVTAHGSQLTGCKLHGENMNIFKSCIGLSQISGNIHIDNSNLNQMSIIGKHTMDGVTMKREKLV